MKNIIWIAIIGILMSSCKGNKQGDLTLDFQLVDNGQTIGMGHTFETNTAVNAKVDKVWFYLSNLTLIGDENEEIEEILLVKLDESGFASIETKAPKGKYSQIQFGIGVPDYLNDADPSAYSEDGHPLNVTENMYWGMAGKYRFISIDGKSDQEKDGIFEGTFTYDLGYSESYRTVSFDKNIEVKKKESNHFVFTIDVAYFFDNTGSEVNIITEPSYHGSLTEIGLSERLATNFKASMSLAD